MPKMPEFMIPVIDALRDLGGSGSIEEIEAAVSSIMGLTDEQLQILHKPESGSGRTTVEYRLAWARSYLKKAGLIENSSRGVWALTIEGSKAERLNAKQLISRVKKQRRLEKRSLSVTMDDDGDEIDLTWQEQLRHVLINLSPASFERLFQRVLRESGFIQVEVTGRSGDGGIDGKGIMRLAGMLSFHVIFQCKRWQSSVGSAQIRDFRGSMIGRADKAIFVTTSTFTPDAVREATRDGAPTIDLIDGDQLIQKLKDLNLGVRSEIVQEERVTILPEWFEGL
jgi:restriction system protein